MNAASSWRRNPAIRSARPTAETSLRARLQINKSTPITSTPNPNRFMPTDQVKKLPHSLISEKVIRLIFPVPLHLLHLRLNTINRRTNPRPLQYVHIEKIVFEPTHLSTYCAPDLDGCSGNFGEIESTSGSFTLVTRAARLPAKVFAKYKSGQKVSTRWRVSDYDRAHPRA